MLPATGTRTLDRYAYDDLGNITMKDDYADLYTYGNKDRTTRKAGPHAVLSVFKNGVETGTFAYDDNGNLTSSTGSDARSVDFDGLDRPTTVKMPPDGAGAVQRVVTQFRYAPDGSRYLQRTTCSPFSPTEKTVYYVDKDYEQIVWASGVTEERTYIGGSVIVRRVGAARDVFYRHQDRLGSSDALTNMGGFEVTAEAHGYDAFGRPRGRDWQPSSDKLHPSGDYGAITELGFTKHEHLDDTYLIHMNGRVYDYRLGRFLSVDPIISNPANSQSINPYSYIGNNPLSGTDPTGHACDDFSTARCDTIWLNPPSPVLLITEKRQVVQTVYLDTIDPKTPMDQILSPGNNPPAQSTVPKGALALDMGKVADAAKLAAKFGPLAPGLLDKCSKSAQCTLIVVGGTVVLWGLGMWYATNPDQPGSPPTATDATGALKRTTGQMESPLSELVPPAESSYRV